MDQLFVTFSNVSVSNFSELSAGCLAGWKSIVSHKHWKTLCTVCFEDTMLKCMD